MPGNDPFQSMDENRSPAEQFEADRLDREGIDRTKYPSQVDRAAIDVRRNIAVGKTDDPTDFGGTVDQFNFDEATGTFYVEGLTAIAGEDSTLAANLEEYDESQVGELAFQLNGFRHTLKTTGDPLDIDRALEALLEKTAASAIDESIQSGRNEGAGLRALRDTNSVSDLTVRLFSDPRVDAYAQSLMSQLPGSNVSRDELIDKLDEARMTTPLWDHQREALERWHQNDQRGYVDMATATGKTVLGLAAIALRYGALHPKDLEEAPTLRDTTSQPAIPDTPSVLIVAGTDLILDQWRGEIDEHLDIPEDRTVPSDEVDHQRIELGWGSIEFRTAQGLTQTTAFDQYDLVILDEAHRYTRGSSGGSGWGAVFENLTAGSNAVLAMSGSVDQGWTGDSTAKDALEDSLTRCYKFDVARARREGVIADFSWEIQYLPATGEQTDRLASQTQITTASYDSETGTLNAERLGVDESSLPDEVVGYDDLRSFVQTNDGNDLRSESTQFDAFASALLARRPLRWNLSPDIDPIASLVDRHAPKQKTVVLVQSYTAAADLKSRLETDYGIPADDIEAFTDTDDNRIEIVDRFNAGSRGVIIGPGDLLGTGVDMPDAEVAVNVSKGSVNASLVQRMGRVLRNPTGEKDATFYHLVAQPVDTDAVDAVEDGARLLRQAAEFRALGESFREVPTYHTEQSITETVIELEDSGVSRLADVEDEDELVEHGGAAEHIRTLQALVYDATTTGEDAESRSTPVIETWTSDVSGSEVGVGEEGQTKFTDRNEAYERYRLSLGPYRAIKSIVTNKYGAQIEEHEEDGEYSVTIDEPEVSGTKLHDELERWLNSYRSWRAHCDNRDGDGEEGSLPEYKSEWPEPPDDKGVMVASDAAAEIGVRYADADPIFFPYSDGELYTIPLPDDQHFTVNGVVDAESTPEQTTTTTEGEGTEQSGYTVDQLLVYAAQSTDAELETVIKNGVSSLLKDAIDGAVSDPSTDWTGPRTSVEISLPDRHERLLNGLVEDDSIEATQVSHLLDVALLRELELTDNRETVEIDPVVLRAAGKVAAERGESTEHFVEQTLRDAVQQEQQES